MYGVLKAHITIGALVFTQTNQVVIEKSVDMLSDLATIKLPGTVYVTNNTGSFDKALTDQVVKVGDRVQISLWYEGRYWNTEFFGWVKQIKPNNPVEIICEDNIYQIRKRTINKLFVSTQLRDILKEVVKGSGIHVSGSVPDLVIDRFLFKNVNGAKALQEIKDEFGLNIYIDDNHELFAGLKQQLNADKNVTYRYGVNVVDSDLEFRRAEDIKFRIKAVGIANDNSRIEVVVGSKESDAEERQYHFYNVSSQAKLKELANAKLTEQQYDGYRGSVTGFLYPYCTRGFAVRIENARYPKQDGTYHADKVKVTFDENGARRETEIGLKISA